MSNARDPSTSLARTLLEDAAAELPGQTPEEWLLGRLQLLHTDPEAALRAADVATLLGIGLEHVLAARLRDRLARQKAQFALMIRRRQIPPDDRLHGSAQALNLLLAKILKQGRWRRGATAFDGPYYLARNPDVAAHGLDPLAHYLASGAAEGRAPCDLSAQAPQCFADAPQDMARLAQGTARPVLAPDLPQSLRESARRQLGQDPPDVSVILPFWNRRATVAAAVGSALLQSHPAREIIAVDDGSIDGGADFLRARFPEAIASGQLKVLEQDHGGVSKARNTGLAAAQGRVIAYLDSDNEWEPDHLLFVCAGLARIPGPDRIAYTAVCKHHLTDGYSDVLFRPFDRDALQEANYIDLNALAHDRSLTDRLGGFDTALTRLVDWDLILRFCAAAQPVGLPVITVHHVIEQHLLRNISLTEPLEPNVARIRAKMKIDAANA